MSEIHRAYLDHLDALKRFLRRFYKRPQDIDDAAQETFLRAYAAEGRQEIGAPKRFLFQVAKHYALNDLQKKSNFSAVPLTDFEGSSVLEDRTIVGADTQIESREKLALLVEAVSQLPPRCRRIFLMRKFDGLRVKDIAEVLGLSVGAVDKQLAIGLARCSAYLVAHGYDRNDMGGRAAEPDLDMTGSAVKSASGHDND